VINVVPMNLGETGTSMPPLASARRADDDVQPTILRDHTSIPTWRCFPRLGIFMVLGLLVATEGIGLDRA